MDKQKLATYANIELQIGLNIRPGQRLMIQADCAEVEIARVFAEQAYALGAGSVYLDLHDPYTDSLLVMNADGDTLDNYPAWEPY